MRRFSSIRGFPYSVHSDNGSQLVAANKELISISKNLESKKIVEFASSNRIDWSFNRSSDAPWQNGGCESLIKSVKVSLEKAVGDVVMTFSELQTVFYEVANIVNSRPIGMKPGNDIDLGVYLCPNDLLLGRNDRHAPYGEFDEHASNQRRASFIQSLITSFWKRWQRDYFPSLLIHKKWHVKQRNVRVGDVVLVQDSNAIRGRWRMGEISEVTVGRDSLVRDVKVRYKMLSDGSDYKGEGNRYLKRSVHRLVVILPIEER